MARYAWVSGGVPCPACGERVMDLTWFAWGGVLGELVDRGPVYAIGERLLWAVADDGTVPANTYWQPATGRWAACNLGEPRARNVDVFEERGVPSRCDNCAGPLHRSCVSIRQGIIVAVSLVPPGVVEDDLRARVYEDAEEHFEDIGELVPLHAESQPT